MKSKTPSMHSMMMRGSCMSLDRRPFLFWRTIYKRKHRQYTIWWHVVVACHQIAGLLFFWRTINKKKISKTLSIRSMMTRGNCMSPDHKPFCPWENRELIEKKWVYNGRLLRGEKWYKEEFSPRISHFWRHSKRICVCCCSSSCVARWKVVWVGLIRTFLTVSGLSPWSVGTALNL